MGLPSKENSYLFTVVCQFGQLECVLSRVHYLKREHVGLTGKGKYRAGRGAVLNLNYIGRQSGSVKQKYEKSGGLKQHFICKIEVKTLLV